MCNFQLPNERLQLKSFIIWVRNYFFLKNDITSEGAISRNALNYMYQQLSIARNQLSFCAKNYFDL